VTVEKVIFNVILSEAKNPEMVLRLDSLLHFVPFGLTNSEYFNSLL